MILEEANKLPVFDRIDRALFKITKIISYGSGICLAYIMLVAFVNVITSKIFRFSIPNANDIVAYMNVPICFLSVAYVQLERGHTNIMLLQSHFHKIPALIVRQFSNLLGAACSAVVGWRGVVQMQAWIETTARSSSNINGIILWPYAGLLAFGYLLLAFCFIWSFIRECAGRGPAVPPVENDTEEEEPIS